MKIPEHWQAALSRLDYAFQPIISYASGDVLAYEALLRNFTAAGYASIDGLFDAAHAEGILPQLEIALRRLAIGKFLEARDPNRVRLFLNIDNRVLHLNQHLLAETTAYLQSLNVSPAFIIFEISEKHRFECYREARRIFAHYRDSHYHLAIDDYGTGFSGLELLYHIDCNFLKVDRFFINDIHRDHKKRLFLKSLIGIAHTLGITTIAEGVETRQEYLICRELGMDAVQGYFVERPQLQLEHMPYSYDHLNPPAYRRNGASLSLDEVLVMAPTLSQGALLSEAFRIFRESPDLSFVVVLNEYGQPLGVLHERLLKKYIYSPVGAALLVNKTIQDKFRELVTLFPVASIQDSLDKLLACFSYHPDADAVIITRNHRYAGMLPSKSLVAMAHEQRLLEASDQNPLSRLPGNRRIEAEMQRIHHRQEEVALLYFDINDFKAFNDCYGFRNGDRIIMLLAGLLERSFTRPDFFVGHVGGDDFWVSVPLRKRSFETMLVLAGEVIARFASDVAAFYTLEDRERGYVESRSREGGVRRFPLMTVSAALLQVTREGTRHRHVIPLVMAALKSAAKGAEPPLACASLL